MTLPQSYPQSPARRQERREMRFPLHLPVLIRMARKETRARSENISLGGILLASDVLIPEGTVVEVVVGVENLPDPGVLLSALGTVLRVHAKTTGDFELAIRLERSFELPFTRREAQSVRSAEPAHLVERAKYPSVCDRAPHFVSWHTET